MAEIVTEEMIADGPSSAGMAALGAILAGPVGILAGLALGGKQKKEIAFAAQFKDGRNFVGTTSPETFRLIKSALLEAQSKRANAEAVEKEKAAKRKEAEAKAHLDEANREKRDARKKAQANAQREEVIEQENVAKKKKANKVDEALGEYVVIGVKERSGDDVEITVEAKSSANAKVKAELKGIIVMEVIPIVKPV